MSRINILSLDPEPYLVLILKPHHLHNATRSDRLQLTYEEHRPANNIRWDAYFIHTRVRGGYELVSTIEDVRPHDLIDSSWSAYSLTIKIHTISVHAPWPCDCKTLGQGLSMIGGVSLLHIPGGGNDSRSE